MQKRILLVEDEDMIRDMYIIAFEGAGYLIETAADGEEAVNKALNPDKSFDLILLDVMLPKLDGLGVLKKIRADGSPSKNTPVYLLTNLGQENLIKEAMNSGAMQYLIKSNFLPKQIVEKVNAFFNADKPD